MNLKSLFSAALIISGLLNATKVSAQSWNVSGNAGTNPSNQFLGTTDASDLRIRTNNAVRMTIRSTGKVGIGTPSPSALFQVQKSTLSDVLIKSTGAGAQLSVDRAANGFEAVTKYMQTGVPQWKTGLMVNAGGNPDYVIKNEITNSDALTISGSTNFVNLNAGYLTLGTTNPGSISQSGNDIKLTAYSPNAGTPGNIIISYAQSPFKTGNVGIGTNDLTRAKLVVSSSTLKTNAIFGQGSTGISLVQNSPSIGFNSYFGTSDWKSMAAGYAAQVFLTPSNGVLNFSFSGNATASDQTLTQTVPMALTPDGRLILNSTNYTSTLGVKKVATANDAASFQGTTLYSHFAFGANEDTYIRGGLATSNVILADLCNNVGVGTANPAYKLDVCGTMRAKEVRVATGWCDYVFADDYKLPALSEVEAFIKTNKHLPEVTPGAVIESEGLEVGKTAAQMIKKIEELTLYVIELQKQVNELKENSK